MSSIADSNNYLDIAIDAYKKMPVLSQDGDPLGFWRDNSVSSLLQPLLPLAGSVAAVPATKAICECLLKAGGQVLTSTRLCLMGSRVKAVLITNFDSKLAHAAPEESKFNEL
jgi:hypothetical protein